MTPSPHTTTLLKLVQVKLLTVSIDTIILKMMKQNHDAGRSFCLSCMFSGIKNVSEHMNSFNNMITSVAPKSLETRIRVASIDLRVNKQFQDFVNRYARKLWWIGKVVGGMFLNDGGI